MVSMFQLAAAQSVPVLAQDLQPLVNSLLQLHQQEPSLRNQLDTTVLLNSLRKAVAPTFEIVFAGAFSAGKSMLINALLERELLYSAEGHATGTDARSPMLSQSKSESCSLF
jgi:predicted GTPase